MSTKGYAPTALPDEEARAASSRTRWLYAAAVLLSLIGLADAIYLTVEHLAGRTARCMVSTGCSTVLASPYANIGGVPLATFGALAYFTVFSLSTLAAFGYRHTQTLLSIVVVAMLLMTLRLLYIQGFVLHQFCDYCLLSAALTILLTGIVIALRVLRPGR
jgi:uncharacterized membrane protein